MSKERQKWTLPIINKSQKWEAQNGDYSLKKKKKNCIKYLKVTRRVDIRNSHHKGKRKTKTNKKKSYNHIC